MYVDASLAQLNTKAPVLNYFEKNTTILFRGRERLIAEIRELDAPKIAKELINRLAVSEPWAFGRQGAWFVGLGFYYRIDNIPNLPEGL